MAAALAMLLPFAQKATVALGGSGARHDAAAVRDSLARGSRRQQATATRRHKRRRAPATQQRKRQPRATLAADACIARRPRACRASHRQPDTLEGRHHERRAHRHLVFLISFRRSPTCSRNNSTGCRPPPPEPRLIVLGALLAHWGQKAPAEIAAKRVFTYRHAQYRADKLGIAFRMPPAHPFNPIKPLRLAIAMGNSPDAIRRIFRHIWRDGRTCRRRKASPRCAKRSIFRKA